MKLSDNDNSFELTISGYEFPNAETEPYDSNWLIARLNSSDTKGSWIKDLPCLLTYEAKALANWLTEINYGDIKEKEIGFIEPMLSFSIIDNGQEKILRVFFSMEAIPNWAKDKEYSLDFRLSKIDLKSASDSLKEQLEKYPQRAEK